MATTIKLKNSVTTTNAPSSLVQGEVAINITDKKVWVGNAATTPIQLLGDGGSGSFTSIAFGAGTVSNPSITFTGDTNTGIYSPAADTIAFTEGGVESMRIDSSGNVGIGTSSPRVVSGYKNLTLDGSTSGLFEINTNGTRVFSVYGASNDINLVNPTATGTMQFYTNNTERMRITSNGGLCVGTTTDPGSGNINLVNGGFYGWGGLDCLIGGTSAASGFIYFRTGATERMRIDSSGVVGINAATNLRGQLEVRKASLSAFTGTSLGNIVVSDSAATADYFIPIDFAVIPTTGTPPIARIAAQRTGSGSYLYFGTSSNYASGITNSAMVIDYVGNVGIGTSSPSSRLSVTGSANIATFDGGTNTSITLTGSGRSDIFLIDSGAATDQKRLTIRGDGGNLIFGVENDAVTTFTERMRITSSGNVGIGTSSVGIFGVSSGRLLNVVASTGYAYLQLQGSAGNGGAIDFGDSSVRCAEIASLSGSALAFYTNPTNSGNALTERMRITSGGYLLVNTTADAGGAARIGVSFAGNATNGINIQDSTTTSGSEFIGFFNSGGTKIGTISRNGTTNAVLYNTTSDYRLKENVTPLTGALEKVAKLKPVTWKWKDSDASGEGFIAHEVQEVVPSAVSGKKDAVDENGKPAYQGMDASYLVATLTAAIQELKAELDSVKAELNQLKGA